MKSLKIVVEQPVALQSSLGIYTLELYDAMRQVAPQHEYLFVAQPGASPLRTDHRILWEQVVLPFKLRQLKPDIYHAPYGASPLPVLCGCPVVTTIHDFIVPRSASTLRLPGKIYSRYFLRTIRHASYLITDSEFTKREAIALAGCRSEQLTPVLLGINPSLFRPLTAQVLSEIRSRLALPASFLLYTGSLEERKGTDTLVKIFASLASEFPDLYLVLTSQNQWESTDYYPLAKTLGIEQRIIHLGFVARSELPVLFNLARLFIFPSRLEGFGLPVLEAMACGTPVVCSNAASLPEVGGDACLQVDPEDILGYVDAARRLLQEEGLHAEYRTLGLKRAGRLTWTESARQTLAVFEEACR